MLFLSLNWSVLQEDPRRNQLTQAHLEKVTVRVVVVVDVVSFGRGPVSPKNKIRLVEHNRVCD